MVRSTFTVSLVALLVLVAMPARAAEGEVAASPKPAPRDAPYRRVTLSVDGSQLLWFAPLVAVTSEARVARRWSIALTAGGGERPCAATGRDVTVAWEAAVAPRWYFKGDFDDGFYAGWAATYLGSAKGGIGYESLGPPPGLGTGPFIGFKSVYVPIITPDVQLGVVAPLVTPSTESSPPVLALVGRFGFGFSL